MNDIAQLGCFSFRGLFRIARIGVFKQACVTTAPHIAGLFTTSRTDRSHRTGVPRHSSPNHFMRSWHRGRRARTDRRRGTPMRKKDENKIIQNSTALLPTP